MKDNRLIGALAGLTLLGAAAWALWVTQGGWSPSVDRTAPESVGTVMAEQALGLLRPGGVITVVARDTATFMNPASSYQLAAFQKVIKRAHAPVISVHTLQLDPLRPVEVPPGDFLEMLRNAPPGSVIVSFMGPPLLSEVQRSQLGEVRSSVVAFCSGSLPQRVDLRALFDQHLLAAAVVSRPRPRGGRGAPHDAREAFDRTFVAVTSANVSVLASGDDPAR